MTNLALALAAGSVLALTLMSGTIKKLLWFSEALACLLVGMIVGPHGAGSSRSTSSGARRISPSSSRSRG